MFQTRIELGKAPGCSHDTKRMSQGLGRGPEVTSSAEEASEYTSYLALNHGSIFASIRVTQCRSACRLSTHTRRACALALSINLWMLWYGQCNWKMEPQARVQLYRLVRFRWNLLWFRWNRLPKRGRQGEIVYKLLRQVSKQLSTISAQGTPLCNAKDTNSCVRVALAKEVVDGQVMIKSIEHFPQSYRATANW